MIKLCETMRKAILLVMLCVIFLSARMYGGTVSGNDN